MQAYDLTDLKKLKAFIRVYLRLSVEKMLFLEVCYWQF